MPGLCDEIHKLGLKAGIYSTPWITSYGKYPGGSSDNADGCVDAGAGQRIGAASWPALLRPG